MGYTPPRSVWKCVEVDEDDVHRRLVAASPTATWHHVVLAREGMVVRRFVPAFTWLCIIKKGEGREWVRMGSLWVIDVGVCGH